MEDDPLKAIQAGYKISSPQSFFFFILFIFFFFFWNGHHFFFFCRFCDDMKSAHTHNTTGKWPGQPRKDKNFLRDISGQGSDVHLMDDPSVEL